MKSDGTVFNFNSFKGSLELASNIYNNKALLRKAKNNQYKMLKQLNDLKEFDPTNRNKINCKKKHYLMQKSCIITGIMSLRHLKMEFFRLKNLPQKKNK